MDGLLGEHEAVLVVDGVNTMDRCQQLMRALRARRPRSRFVALLADPLFGPDLDLVAELLEAGEVPVLTVADGAAEAMAALLAERLHADTVLRLVAGSDDAPVLVAFTVATPVGAAAVSPAGCARRPLQAVAGGWCARRADQPCMNTAAVGCYSCQDFHTERRFLPVHADTLARTREVAASAEAAGQSRIVDINRRLAGAVERLVDDVDGEDPPTDAAA